MTLRPSISRAERGTLEEWAECVEIKMRTIYGTPSPEQEMWAETFNQVPPLRWDIAPASDLFPREAQR